MTHCGMHSHSSAVADGLSNYIHQVGAEECRMIHQYRVLKIHQCTIGGILNGTTSASVNIHGSLDNQGNCQGADYYENGASWKSVVITATVRITAMDYFAVVRLDSNEISLKGGVTCPYLKGYCFDSTIGESTWDSQIDGSCEKQMSLLYDGPAERVTNKISGEIYIVVDSDAKIFAFSLIKRIYTCGWEIWQTEHPRLLLQEGTKSGLLPSGYLLPANTNLMMYVNSKFLYVEQSYKRELDKLSVDTIYRRCLVRREILKNRLLLAPIVPDVVSQLIQNREGHMGHVVGEVLYILKCIPKLVRIRRTNNCYQELPVTLNNHSLFMSPITRVLQDHAEEIDCNSLAPPLFYIEGEWIGLVPHPTVKRPPRELEVEIDQKIEFKPIQPLGSRGLYTQEEVNKVQRLLTFGTERKVVGNIIARRIAGMEADKQGFSTLEMFDPEEMEKLAYSTMRQLWGWFTDLGLFVSGLLGFYVIFKTFKYVIGVVINGLHLYQTVGGGFKLLACLWNTLTMWVLSRHQQRNAQAPGKEADINTEPVIPPSGVPTVQTEQCGSLYPRLVQADV